MPVGWNTAMIAASRRWANGRPWPGPFQFRYFNTGEHRDEIAGDLRRPQPGHRVSKRLLAGPPPEGCCGARY
jgi:hypothetical protein